MTILIIILKKIVPEPVRLKIVPVPVSLIATSKLLYLQLIKLLRVYFTGMSYPDVVRLNVGGLIYTTSRATLCKYPDSMLGAMFSGDYDVTYDESGCVFIDRDETIFRHVLNFLRSSKLILPQKFEDCDSLESEADFYQIQPLIGALNERKKEQNQVVKGKNIASTFIEVCEKKGNFIQLSLR